MATNNWCPKSMTRKCVQLIKLGSDQYLQKQESMNPEMCRINKTNNHRPQTVTRSDGQATRRNNQYIAK